MLGVRGSSQNAVPFPGPFRQRTSALAHAVSALPNQAAQPTLPSLLSGEDRQRETEAICFPFDGICRGRRLFLKAAWTLRRQGIILISEVLNPDQLERFQGQINLLLDAITHHETSGLDDIAYLNLPDQRVLKGYNTFVDADRAVINHRIKRADGRSGSDAGMIDIFHPERLSDEIKDLVATSLQEPIIRRLVMTSCLTPLHVKCRNLYINRGVQDTRSFHCDGRRLRSPADVCKSRRHGDLLSERSPSRAASATRCRTGRSGKHVSEMKGGDSPALAPPDQSTSFGAISCM